MSSWSAEEDTPVNAAHWGKCPGDVLQLRLTCWLHPTRLTAERFKARPELPLWVLNQSVAASAGPRIRLPVLNLLTPL